MHTEVLNEIKNYPFLIGGGETGELIRSIDWSKTPLGPPEEWQQSLRTCIRIILTSRQPMFIWWGKDLINIYNDAYIDIVRGKHPEAMGQPAATVWREIWDQVGPRADTVMNKNEGTYDEALLLIMERNGYPEETYYTFSYSPVPGDEGGTAGIICANTDDTERIIGERQLRTLKDLGKSLIDCKSNGEVFTNTINVLKQNQQDFPFVLIYEVTDNGIKFCNASPKKAGNIIPLDTINQEPSSGFSYKISEAISKNKFQVIDQIQNYFKDLPSGSWPTPPHKMLILPFNYSGQKRANGLLVVGINPFRVLDDKYFGFFQLICDQIITSISNVHAYEQERRRAEALAEIDRAKTTFFSNISHEFRTPLTLMLSPLEEIRKREVELPADILENIDISYRNTLRLQKLVNTLLDFSRIEAGRMQANYRQINMAAYTKDLVSLFRSAIEKAGMKLIVDCAVIKEPVYVDSDMWEKIVLNLLSNAFKYTTEGKIVVKLFTQQNQLILSVSDTGAGIPETEKDRIFERFHRIQNIKGRTQEGTGIGLALVQELVRLHQGSITVESQLGKGSTFTVSIPLGADHLPADKISHNAHSESLSGYSDAYVEEALKWLPLSREGDSSFFLNNVQQPETKKNHTTHRRPIILLADDNADMRSYVHRLLSNAYDVMIAPNGKVALELIDHQIPDLIISDVMMPEMDGFELIKRLKSTSLTAQIPVILLSARAGEEATVEGLQTGADEYLVKPFSAKELLSRVNATLKLSQSRREVEKQYSDLFLQAPIAICMLKGPELIIELANEKMLEIWGKSSSVSGKPLLEALPEITDQDFPRILNQVYTTGIPYNGREAEVYLYRYGKKEHRFVNFVYQPVQHAEGTTHSILVIAYDVTEQVEARHKIEDAEERLRIATEGTGIGTYDLNLITGQIIYSSRLNEIFGFDRTKVMTHQEMRQHVHPDDIHSIVEKAFDVAMQTGHYYYEARVVWDNGTIRWIRTQGKVIYNEEQTPIRLLGTMMDITEQKTAQKALKESEERYRQLAQELEIRVQKRTKDLSEAIKQLARSNKELEQFAFVTSHDLQEPLRKIQTFSGMLLEQSIDQLDEKSKGYLQKMQNASKRMSNLIRDLLNFSRLSRSDDQFIETDLNEIFSNIVNDFELQINQKHAAIKSNKLPKIEANPLQMNQLFYNLISNALKFSKMDISPVIEVSCRKLNENEVIEAQLRPEIPYYEILIKDNGIGFAQEYSKKIFEIFQRLNARPEYEGTGIGLALANKIVQRHKGVIYAHSEENKGATFYIILPERQSKV